MITAVSAARWRSEANTASTAPSERRRRPRLARARRRSAADRPGPASGPTAFHSDWPWRTSSTRVAAIRPTRTRLASRRMAVDLSLLGKTSDPVEFEVDGRPSHGRTPTATNDANPALPRGECAPPVFAVVPAFDALGAPERRADPARLPDVHRPRRAGHALPPAAAARHAAVDDGRRPSPCGSAARAPASRSKAESVDARPASRCVTQYFTIFVRGMSDGESGGPDKPDARLPRGGPGEAARRRLRRARRRRPDLPLPRRVGRPDADPRRRRLRQVRRPARHHRPRPLHHGDVLARPSCSAPATAIPTRLDRLAVRFAANVFPGNDVEVQLYDAGSGDGRGYAFEATSAGATRHQERPGRGRGRQEELVAVLRLFAAAREAAGTGRDDVPGATVGEVLDAAVARYGAALRRRARHVQGVAQRRRGRARRRRDRRRRGRRAAAGVGRGRR